MNDLLSKDNLPIFQRALLDWFQQHKRIFPWRQVEDPYAILIAEKLLQQTAVNEYLVVAYKSILSEYPSIERLAQANVEMLREIILPLGLPYRAQQLVILAKQISEEYSGHIPNSLSKLLSLKGVGEYTARAILSFAYGEDMAIVDTNVARFLFRLYGITGPMPKNPARNRKLISLADELIPSKQAKNFNLAILDLCAAICRSSKPLCDKCPVRPFCNYGMKTLNV